MADIPLYITYISCNFQKGNIIVCTTAVAVETKDKNNTITWDVYINIYILKTSSNQALCLLVLVFKELLGKKLVGLNCYNK